jgi:hypothetical protein
MVETFFTYLFLIDFLALFLIMLRKDRNDFYAIIINDYTTKRYFDLVVFFLMCYILLWLTIPISIQQIINDQKQDNE